MLDDDKMLFQDEIIKIEPAEGEIWPNSSTEVTIIFRPLEHKEYDFTVFCDVTGRESRLPLHVTGKGMGPRVQLSFDEIDLGNVFINSTHIYEVVLANKGDIDAIFNVSSNKSVFGPCFQFNPSEGIVMPDGHQAVQITFKSEVLGEFREEFDFQIDGLPEPHKLRVVGNVIGPTFHFDIPKLRFGTVSYGFPSTQTCKLTNTSLVPMQFRLCVPDDGGGDKSISSLEEYDRYSWH